MARNQTSEGIVLKSGRIGEIHKSVTFLSPTLGIINAIAHGAYKGKSKLGGVTEVFSRSTISLYYNPPKNSYKITDVDPISYYENLRRDLEKYYIASLWAEVILRTYAGGGEFHGVYALCCEAMTLLDRCRSDKNSTALSFFLFEYIDHLGYLPDFGSCAKCGVKLAAGDHWYVGEAASIYCPRCADTNLPKLSPGARRCLAYARGKSVSEKLKVDLDGASSADLKRAMIAIVQHVIGGALNTLRGAGGIL